MSESVFRPQVVIGTAMEQADTHVCAVCGTTGMDSIVQRKLKGLNFCEQCREELDRHTQGE